MRKVLCIANFLFGNASGAQSLAKSHIEALYQTFGEDNVIVFALVGTEKVETNNDYIIERVENKYFKRIINLLKGNTGKINSEIINRIIEMIRSSGVDLLFVDDSIYGNAIKIIKKRCPNIKVASFYHDIKRYLAIEWAKKNLKSIPIQLSLIINEWKTARYADVNIVLNAREARLFRKYYHKDPEMILPIILQKQERMQELRQNKVCNILFVGGYYYPNVNGFRWFVEKVTPLLEVDYNLILVGNKMDILKDEFKKYNNITVLGRVEKLTPYYENANVVIGPIFEGAGMKVKTAEAFSYGKIYIGTDESLEGYKELANDLIGKSIFICNDEVEFANVINNNTFSTFCKENYDFFIQNYSIEAAIKKIETL